MSTKCADNLFSDHQCILQALEVLRQMCVHVEHDEVVSRGDIYAVLEFFRDFAHRYQDGKEQSILIPALVAAGLRLREGPLTAIISEHREVHHTIGAMQESPALEDDEEFVRLATRYRKLLMDHIRQEDRFLFECMSLLLTHEEDDSLLSQFEEFEQTLRDIARRHFDRVVEALERKYSNPHSV